MGVNEESNFRLSVSKIEEYLKCPYSFWLTNIKKEEIKTVPKQLQEGIEKHKMFEDVVKKTKSELKTSDNSIKALEKNIVLMKDFKKYENDCKNFMKFCKNIAEKGGNPLPEFSEIKIFNSGLNLAGVIDRVDFDGKNVLILDYKTGKDNNIDNYYFQLATYVILFEDEYFKSVSHWGIFFTKSGNFLIEPVNRLVVQNAKDKIMLSEQMISSSVKTKYFPKTPNPLCNWCTWYQNKK